MQDKNKSSAIDLLEQADRHLQILGQSLEVGDDNVERYFFVKEIQDEIKMALEALSPL